MKDFVKKFARILERRDQKRLCLLLGAFLIMAMLEVLGIASILPFMSLVVRPELVHENRWLQEAYQAFGFQSETAFLIAAGVAVLIFITAANAFSLFTRWMQFRVTNDTSYRLEKRLLVTYTYRPYAFFLTRSSADLGKQVLNEVHQFVSGFLLPLTELVARSAVAIFIIGLLFVVNPTLSLIVVGVLGGLYALIYFVVRRYLARLGERRIRAVRRRYKVAGEVLGGIKSVKVQGCESYFTRRFARASKVYADIRTRYTIIGPVPRYLVETFAFGGIITIVLYLLSAGEAVERAIPLLSLYALAGYRLLPALQHLFSAVASVRYNRALVDGIYDDLRHAPHPPLLSNGAAKPLSFERKIVLENVTFRYEGTEEDVVRGISLRIEKGMRVAFVGATGSGKTTLVDIVMGLLELQAGQVRVDGIPIMPNNVRAWRAGVGYVPQEVFFIDDTIARNIAFGLEDEAIDQEQVQWAAQIASVHDFIEGLPNGYSTKIGERGVRLSGGQRQRLGLARAMYRRPQMLIMDEATSALDGITEEAVMEAINSLSYQVTMIMIAHRLPTVKGCDYIYMLEHGCLVAQGTYQELVEFNSTFRAMARLTS